MPADASPEVAGGGLLATSWALVTNPYWLSALACGALAVGLAYALSASPSPRDAKRRFTIGDVRRVAEASFAFRSASSTPPYFLLDASARRICALLPSSTNETAREDSVTHSSAQRLSITLPYRPTPFRIGDYVEQPMADVERLRVLDWGLHLGGGRSIAIEPAQGAAESVLQFNSRSAAATFLDVLYSVKEQRVKRPDSVRLFLTTFNVGNAQPADDLTPWLGEGINADIIAIGAQECSYSPTTSASMDKDRLAGILTGSGDSLQSKVSGGLEENTSEATPLLNGEQSSSDSLSRHSNSLRSASSQLTSTVTSGKDHWHALLSSHFPEDEFRCVAQLSAWDRCLTIFVRKSLVPAVSRVRHDTANVGLGGVAGNKGAIAARFSVYDTDFVIVNSHLAAHHKEVNRRNEDFASIASGLRGIRDNPEVDVFSSSVHHVFWMGDLNYRINLERDRVLELIKEQDWTQLQEADQLIQERNAGRAFHGFQEGRTNFAPTYRYESGSRKYSDVKLRIPSYCDRILFRSLTGCSLQLHEYKPADEIVTSDHSPVYGTFTAGLVHTTGTRSLATIADEAAAQEARELGMMAPIISPRSLTMRSLIPSGLPVFSGSSGLELQFRSLRARDIPEMDHGGRRIAVAKALNIHNHVGWKKHDELGEGQHADPYCTFHGDVAAELDEGVYRTSTVIASQNPVWEPEAIPKIDLIGFGASVTRRKHIVITVKNENSVRRDDPIGSAVLWLGGNATSEVESNDAQTQFSLPLMLAGKSQGVVEGSYVIRKV